MAPSLTRHLLPASWLPQTFAARVFLVFALTTFLGTVVGLALLNYQQFNRHVAGRPDHGPPDHPASRRARARVGPCRAPSQALSLIPASTLSHSNCLLKEYHP